MFSSVALNAMCHLLTVVHHVLIHILVVLAYIQCGSRSLPVSHTSANFLYIYVAMLLGGPQ